MHAYKADTVRGKENMNTENRIYKIARRAKLFRCDRCPPHRKENAERIPARSWKFRSRSTRQWEPKPFGFTIEKGNGFMDGSWMGLYGDNFIRWFDSEAEAQAWLDRHSKPRANSRSNKNLSQKIVENKSRA